MHAPLTRCTPDSVARLAAPLQTQVSRLSAVWVVFSDVPVRGELSRPESNPPNGLATDNIWTPIPHFNWADSVDEEIFGSQLLSSGISDQTLLLLGEHALPAVLISARNCNDSFLGVSMPMHFLHRSLWQIMAHALPIDLWSVKHHCVRTCFFCPNCRVSR